MKRIVAEGLGWTEVLQQLLLARLLAAGKRPLPFSQVRTALGGLCRDLPLSPSWSEQLEGVQRQCIAEGYLRERPLELTELGREACIQFWGISPSSLPAARGWQHLVRKVIVPRLLGVPAGAFDVQDPGKALRLLVLKRRFGLPDSLRTEKQVLDALAWRELGIETTVPFSAKAVIARCRLQTERPLQGAAVLQHLVRSELVPSERDWFLAVLRSGLAELATPAGEVSAPAPSVELADFARLAVEAARQSRTGQFGDHKVFLSHVWRQMQADPRCSDLTEEQFRAQLVEAHRQQLLVLGRADLVERMDPQDVAESEVRYLNGRFHFLCV